MPDLTTEANVEIATRILSIRGQRVLLDQDLALLYGVTIKRLNQQVRRNMEKFPGDFLFQLDPAEADSLRMHFASLKKGRGSHRKHAPLAFTEHGAIMAATVLSSPRAVQMSVYVVRAFVKLRQTQRWHGASNRWSGPLPLWMPTRASSLIRCTKRSWGSWVLDSEEAEQADRRIF